MKQRRCQLGRPHHTLYYVCMELLPALMYLPPSCFLF
jgi:hypothetical protein